MSSGVKFYVYGGGRWREVDVNNGKVAGWGPARFVYVRRGRLAVARRAPVLRGLRALQDGAPTTVRDGPQLSIKRYLPKKLTDKKRGSSCGHCRCCSNAKNNNNISPTKSKPGIDRTDVCQVQRSNMAIQTSQTLALRDIPEASNKVTTTALIHTQIPQKEHATPRKELPTPRKEHATPQKEYSTPQKEHLSSRKEHSSPRKEHSSSRKEHSSPRKEHSSSRKKHTSPRKDHSSPRIQNMTSQKEHLTLQKERSSLRKEHSSLQKENSTPRKESTDRTPISQTKNKRPRSSSSDLEIIHTRTQKRPRLSLKKSPRSIRAQKRARSLDQSQSLLKQGLEKFKTRQSLTESTDEPKLKEHRSEHSNAINYELIISEEDVVVIRKYLAKTGQVDLNRFDTDDVYKSSFFYKLNPLLNVERCPRIANMLTANAVSLKDFASQLGLRSVLETSEPRRRYPRRRRKHVSSVSSYSDNNLKENTVKEKKSTTEMSDRNINKKRFSQRNNNARGNVIVSDSDRSVSRISTEMEEEENLAREVNGVRKRVKSSSEVERVEAGDASEEEIFRPLRDRGSGKESKLYSIEEDTCIARWMLSHERGRRASGNRVWAALAVRYRALTGRQRSWHSLRNRYLRYILPQLHRLPLRPDQQRALREQHTRGEIKSQRAKSRRNSIFGAPAPGASSRRPAPPPSPVRGKTPPVRGKTPPARGKTPQKKTPVKHKSPVKAKATPRYSEVTRQFVASHRARVASSTSETSAEPDRSGLRRSGRLEKQSEPERPRTRRLYNPSIAI